MRKQYLLRLIDRMNTPMPFDKHRSTNLDRTDFGRAWARARKMRAHFWVAPLIEIVDEYPSNSKADRAIRTRAYNLLGHIHQNHPSDAILACLLRRITVENDKYILSHLLDHIAHGSIMPRDADIVPILRCVKDDRWLVHQSAIHALGSVDTDESRAMLREILQAEANKSNEYDICYAIGALDRIGQAEDIAHITRHRDSRIKSVRGAADFVTERLRDKFQPK